MEAETSQHLPSAGWRSSKANGEIQSESGRLGMEKPMVPVQVQRPENQESKGRRKWMSEMRQRANSPFLYFFVLPRPSLDWGLIRRPPTMVKVIFTQSSDSNANLFWKKNNI